MNIFIPSSDCWALIGKISTAIAFLALLVAGLSLYGDSVAEERLRQVIPAEKLTAALRAQTLLQTTYRLPVADTAGRRLGGEAYNDWIDSLKTNAGEITLP